MERCGASATSDEVTRGNEKRETGREYETGKRGKRVVCETDEGVARDGGRGRGTEKNDDRGKQS